MELIFIAKSLRPVGYLLPVLLPEADEWRKGTWVIRESLPTSLAIYCVIFKMCRNV